MDKEEKWEGEWYLAGPPNHSSMGELVYKPGESLLLTLRMTAEDWQHSKNYWTALETFVLPGSNRPTIFGLLTGAQTVTLLDCRLSIDETHPSGHKTLEIDCEKAIMGRKIQDANEKIFTGISARITNLDVWYSPKGSVNIGEKVFSKPPEITINLDQKNTKIYRINKNTQLEIHQGHSFKWNSREADLKEYYTFLLKFDSNLSIHELNENLHKFCLLHEVLTAHACHPYNVGIHINPNEEENEDTRFDLKSIWITPKKYNDNLHPHLLLSTYDSIKLSYSDLLSKWFQIYDEYRPPIAINSSENNAPAEFDQQKFLNATRAIEGLHRVKYHGKDFNEPEKAYQSRLDRIRNKLNPEDYSWIQNKIGSYGNLISLKKRIEQFLADNPSLYQKNNSWDDIPRKVVKLRNILTHPSSQNNKARDDDIYEMIVSYYKLRILFAERMLSILGLETELINQLIQSYREYAVWIKA